MTAPTPWLDPDEQAAWMSLMAMVMTLPPAVDAQLKRDSGLNFFEYSILSQLSAPPDRALQMTQLAKLVGGTLSRLSHAASRLEKQGLVRRRVISGESRWTELVLTDEGMSVLAAAAPGHVREARRLVFDRLTREQVAQLRAIAGALTEAASPEVAATLEGAIKEADAARPDEPAS
ncbi:MarR family transcriptional regulator [Pseudonocardia zijingensis]|uniref:MarR family transcriptional regulator n=1 Tax=Pseudonocardia zijingensis TaxID=153376 RepID=A0ABN1N6Y6_9PSEU